MYRYKASSLVVLGDPLGDENAFDELLEAFYNYAEYLGYDVIFLSSYRSTHAFIS